MSIPLIDMSEEERVAWFAENSVEIGEHCFAVALDTHRLTHALEVACDTKDEAAAMAIVEEVKAQGHIAPLLTHAARTAVAQICNTKVLIDKSLFDALTKDRN
ncbi:MAG: hypothetical protein HQK59_01695 [Deltaproteobacteria bacterium]|nr:hypothetical protein [Deltaproteobacteria bacterium]